MIKAYFCIDGFSFKRINDFYKYEHRRHSRLNLSAFESYLRYEMKRRMGISSDVSNLVFEKHFYHPNQDPRQCPYKSDIGDAILKFESNVVNSNYVMHYAQNSSTLNPKPNENLFMDSVVAAKQNRVDIFILLSTQGQYACILKQMKNCGIPSVLVCWNSICKNSYGNSSFWRTDSALRNSANVCCPLEKILNLPNGKHPIVESMFAGVPSLSIQITS